ncbi:MAG: tetratricopeptide repeat protein [Chthoniobacterales bacterium]
MIIRFASVLVLLVSFLLITTGSFSPLHAQSAGAAQTNKAALEAYQNGDYENAAKLYGELIKNYPTDALVTVARIQLGYSEYFLGEFDKSRETLAKALQDPALPTDLKALAMSFLPQAISASAASMKSDDPKRKARFEEAIKAFDAYLKAYPRGDDVESAVFGRAIANYQIGNYQEAANGLEANLKNFANSPTILDSQNLLAITLATIGSQELMKGDATDTTKGFAAYERALGYLEDIIKKKTDLTLVNDAQFQLAEILFNKAAFSPEADRPELYKRALDAYRSVVPNEEMIELQREKLSRIPERRRQLTLRRDEAGLKALNREFEREQRKMGELRSKQDQIATATLKTAEIYFNEGDYNRARVMLRHITPFLQSDDNKLRAQYFLTMTYALQNVTDLAVQNYETFQSEHKGAPVAQNLPITMGNLFLNNPDPEKASPEKAIQYYDESLAIYPEGETAALSTIAKAMAQTRLQQMQEAEKTFTSFLSGNPSPRVAVMARAGLADLYKLTGQWDKAIAEYQTIIKDFADTPQAKDSQFWIAVCTQQKGDHAGAIPLLKQFIADQPDSGFIPTALYSLGVSQIATGARDDGMASYAELAEKYPDSTPAPFSYFMRAQILSQEGKTAEVNDLLRKFIEKYPDSENVYAAYDTIARNSVSAGDYPAAVKVYRDYFEKYPATPKAAEALLNIAENESIQVDRLGRFGALKEDERNQWITYQTEATQAIETILQQFSDSAQVAPALGLLLKIQKRYLAAESKSTDEIQDYFNTLAESSPSASARSKALFTLASFIAERDEEQALSIMDDAYDPQVVYSPEDIDFYGLALIDKDNTEKAEAVFAKLAKDYPNPAGVDPTQAPAPIQQAQATALFGQARVAQQKGDTAQASTLFQELKKLYPWSPKVLEAELGIAKAEYEAKKLADAIARLPAIMRSQTATVELKADATMLYGDIMLLRAKESSDPKEKEEKTLAAIDYYLQIAAFYPAATRQAAEGLWKGAQLLEEQIKTGTNSEIKAKQQKSLHRAYNDLVENYPNSPNTDAARSRLAALGSAS